MFGLHAAIIVYLGNRFCSVIVSVLVSSAVDNGFEARTGQTKDYKIDICCFPSKNAA
jgi:hypothetical protein